MFGCHSEATLSEFLLPEVCVGIRLKLSLMIVLCVVGVTGAIGGIAIRNEEDFLREDVELKGLQMLRALAIPCAVPLAKNKQSELDDYIAGFDEGEGQDLDLLWIGVLDQSGKILSHTKPERYQQTLSDAFTQNALKQARAQSEWDEEDRLLRLAMPIAISGLRFGTLRAEMSLARLDQRIQLLRLEGVALIIGGLLVAVLGLAYFLSKIIIRPLVSFSEVAKRLEKGDFTARVAPQKTRDEIGVLGEIFNSMAASLQRHTEELESLVEERTRELKAVNERLSKLAITDELTGLYNHRYFQETLRFESLRTDRKGGPLSLLMIDVDYFKKFNDTHGHPAGDKLLRALAQLYQTQLRSIDIVARYGGEEFAIVLLDTSKQEALQVAEKLRASVANTPFPGGETQPNGRLSISIGLATLPQDATNPAELVVIADKALYEAKHTGRNNVCASPDTPDLSDKPADHSDT
jgi:two-component system, cell cycle response regulator